LEYQEYIFNLSFFCRLRTYGTMVQLVQLVIWTCQRKAIFLLYFSESTWAVGMFRLANGRGSVKQRPNPMDLAARTGVLGHIVLLLYSLISISYSIISI